MDRVIRLARTMAWLRWRLMLNSLRTVRGLGETVGWVLVLLLGSVLAAGGAVAGGLGVWSGLVHGKPEEARVVLGVAWGIIGALALLIPVLLGEGRAELAPRRLLQFPVSRTDLFWTGMLGGALSGTNLLWYPAMAATVVGAAASGRVAPLLILPAGVLATASILAAQQALLMGVQWIATSRRLRETATVLAIFLFVGLAQLPSILNEAHARARPGSASVPPAVGRALLGVAESLPPVLAARLAMPTGMLDGVTGLLGLLLWTGLGVGAAWKLYLGGLERRPGGGGVARPARSAGRHGLEQLLGVLPPEVAALALKQLRYTLRSTSGRIALLMSPLIGLILTFMSHGTLRATLLGLPSHDGVFLFLCLMAGINVSQLTANLFQWDRGGAALYFATPVAPARVLAGLDLGLWLFQSLTSLGMLATYMLVGGIPGRAVLLSGLLLLLGGQIAAMLAGCLLSIVAPSPRDIGTSRNRLPLLSSLAMIGVTAATMLLFGLPAILLLRDHPGLAPLVLLVPLLLVAGLYRAALPALGRLLAARREDLLAALKSRPG
ncbi:MAG: hypothetical protein GXP47_03625 [Acidobacteria bacterium]|nr:hypothetical protein [Acidobacteriota bacterium]